MVGCYSQTGIRCRMAFLCRWCWCWYSAVQLAKARQVACQAVILERKKRVRFRLSAETHTAKCTHARRHSQSLNAQTKAHFFGRRRPAVEDITDPSIQSRGSLSSDELCAFDRLDNNHPRQRI